MRDPFWEDVLEHLLTLQTEEEREDFLRGFSSNVAWCLRAMLDIRIERALYEIERQLSE